MQIEPPPSGGMPPHRAMLLIVLVSLLVYSNTAGNRFTWQDHLFITARQGIAESWSELGRLFTRGLYAIKHDAPPGQSDLYFRPLMNLSFTLDHLVWNDHPDGYRLTNILWHALNGVLLYLAAAAAFRSRTLALTAALLFAVHPVHTASVSYVTNRLDVLCLAFMLAAWRLWTQVLADGKPHPAALPALAPIFAAGLLAKETAIVLPLLLAAQLVNRWPELSLPARRRGAAAMGLLLLTGGAYLLLRAQAIGSPGGRTIPFPGGTGDLVLTMLNVGRHYLRVLILPYGLTTSGGFAVARLPPSAADAWSILLVTGTVLWSLERCWRGKPAGLAAAWLWLPLLPVANLIPILYLRSHHFLYIPSAGFCLLLAAGLDALARRLRNRLALPLMAGLLIAGYAAATLRENRLWRDDLTRFTASVRQSPHCRESRAHLGFALQAEGRHDEAIGQFEQALAPVTDYYSFVDPARVNRSLGQSLLELGRLDAAEAAWHRAVALQPEHPLGHLGLGNTAMARGSFDEAVTRYRAALEKAPGLAVATRNLAAAHAAAGDAPAAIRTYRTLLANTPGDLVSLYYLADLLIETGEPDEALHLLQRAASLAPGHPQIEARLHALGNP